MISIKQRMSMMVMLMTFAGVAIVTMLLTVSYLEAKMDLLMGGIVLFLIVIIMYCFAKLNILEKKLRK